MFVIALLLGAATWGAWLGWDQTNYYDSSIGTHQGPYRPAQVVGCALTFGLLTALLAVRWSGAVVAAGMSLGFWVGWTVQASTQDETGLFVVGSILLFVGLAAGSAVASAIGFAARPLVSRLRSTRRGIDSTRGPKEGGGD